MGEKIKTNIQETIDKIEKELDGIVEYKTEIVGVTENQSKAIALVFDTIDKHSLTQINAEINRLEADDKEITAQVELLQRIQFTFEENMINNDVYTEVVDKIEALENEVKPIRERLVMVRNLKQEQLDKLEVMKKHIEIISNEKTKTATWVYNKAYFEPILDLAELLLGIKVTK